MRALFLALFVGGCVPSVPFVVGETAETLAPRQVSLAVYSAAGGGSVGAAGGSMVRLRVGVGHEQEVGFEGGAYWLPNAWGAAKLTWKLHLREHYAVVGGVGASFAPGWANIGGDFGVIASTKMGDWPAYLYTGLRATFMSATTLVLVEGGGIIPLGLAWDVRPRLRIAIEAGGIAGVSYNHVGNFGNGYAGWFGGYGAVLVGGVFGR